MRKLRIFIKNLQRADDKKKRRWYLGTSIVAISLVLFAWGWYVSAFVIGGEPAESANAGSEGLLQTFSKGLQAIKGDALDGFENPENAFGGAIGGILNKANETRDIVIETPDSNFYFDGAEEMPTSSLPIVPRK